MNMLIAIGGEEIQINAPGAVIDCVARRHGPFVRARSRINDRAPIVIEVTSQTRAFSSIIERSPKARVRAPSPNEITIDGAITARYDVSARKGFIKHAKNLGDIDTMLRLVLSVTLPLANALLMHGAALNNSRFGAMALCGDSGAGKSTAAEAFGAACDELIVLRPENETVNLCATPYWRGVPLEAPCQGVVCLLRGGEPAFVHERGAGAIRQLTRHVVRFISFERTERAILRLLSLIAQRTPIMTARCPGGDAYIPYLSEKLTQMVCAAA
jgi:hypothetical protein